MLPFFNTSSYRYAAAQTVTAASLGYVLYDFMNNPQATVAEYGFEIIVLAFDYYALSKNAGNITVAFSWLLDAGRLGAAYAGVTSGCSSMSLLQNIYSGLSHATTMAAELSA